MQPEKITPLPSLPAGLNTKLLSNCVFFHVDMLLNMQKENKGLFISCSKFKNNMGGLRNLENMKWCKKDLTDQFMFVQRQKSHQEKKGVQI